MLNQVEAGRTHVSVYGVNKDYRQYMMVVLFCLCIGVGGNGMLSKAFGAQDAPFWTESPSGPVPTMQVPNFADLAGQLMQAVVNISTTQSLTEERRRAPGAPLPRPHGERDPFEEFFERFFGGSRPQHERRRSGLGSGVVINKDGHILTNNHMVENATDIKVSLSDKEEFNAKVVGRDPKTDVALIKIEAARDLPVAPLGNSDRLQVGEWVMAIGNPFGLGHTVTVGIASAKGRIIGAGPYDDFIQADVSINPGNSGGPLFNMNGQVIGINTAIVATGQGIGFAIPINLAKGILTQLHEQGKVTRGWLGVQVQQVTPELAKSFGLGSGHGALVADVQANSPAARAGIQHGDVIVEFKGQKIKDVNELPLLVANTPPQTEVEVKLIRHAQEQAVQLKVDELKEEQQQAATGGDISEGKPGLAVQELPPDLSRKLGLPNGQGVLVANVEEGTPAHEAGIQRGDVILEVNQQQVTNVQDYQAALGRKGDANTMLLLIRRGENTVYMALRSGD
jgi:serine protease Do